MKNENGHKRLGMVDAIARCIQVRWRWLVAVCLVCAAVPAMAGPPYRTDDPEPVDYQHYEAYLVYTQTLNSSGRTAQLPAVEFNYGALPDLHLHIIVPYGFNTPTGGKQTWGWQDIELGVKYRFVEETENTPMIGTFPIYHIPTGNADRGLGNGGAQLFLPLWLQKSWGKWQTYGGGGYWINNGSGNKDFWYVGWQLQHEITEHLTLGGEIFHYTEQIIGQGPQTGFNIGGGWNFDEHNHIIFSAGKGLQNATATNQFSSYLAFQYTY